MEGKARRRGGVQGDFGGVIAAVLEEFDSGERRTQKQFEGLPMAGFVEGGAHAASGIAEPGDPGHSREPTGGSEY